MTSVRLTLLTAGFALGVAGAAVSAPSDVRPSAAAEALALAQTAPDPVAALTEVIRDMEIGLSGLRQTVGQSLQRERDLDARIAERRDQISQVLAALERISAQGQTDLVLHPEGALATARAASLLSNVAPALQTEVAEFQAQRDNLHILTEDRIAAMTRLEDVLAEAELARDALTQAVFDRQDEQLDVGRASGVTSSRLSTIAQTATDLGDLTSALPALRSSATDPGSLVDLDLPVTGDVLRGFNEPDAAGKSRAGLTVAVRPAALVEAPFAGTVRYAGPVNGFGQVVILEPARDRLLVLSGINRLYVTDGETVRQGAPLGLMGGDPLRKDTFPTPNGKHAGTLRPETLYIETRDSNTPVDPAMWFAVRKD